MQYTREQHMGEYYRIVNTDRKEWIEPLCIGSDIKIGGLMRKDETAAALAFLLAETENSSYPFPDLYGSWNRDTITIVGDTTELYTTVEEDQNYTMIAEELREQINSFAEECLLQDNRHHEI